jgi:two-component sensor histidine kinase
VWRREWFIGILLLLVTGVVISVVRLREQSLVKMNALLEMRVKHRTRMLERKHREKELLLQEVHHRVKNNLQIVISLLNLQARHVKDPATKDVMQAIRSRVRSMALLHERLYRHNNLEHIDLEDYIREICESLYAAYGVSEENVTLYLNIPDITIDLDSAITLGLIVNELISNSLKYAFPEATTGKLGIELFQMEKDHYQLMVWDNGIGSTNELNQQQSFGLQLVSSLTKKLGGEIKHENINGTKTILFFVLPS